MANSINYSSTHISLFTLFVFVFGWGSQTCQGQGKFGFDMHHLFSDPVKGLLPVDDLPEKGSVEYYVAMSHRDRVIRSRRLAAIDDQNQLTFVYGNDTHFIGFLGFLHYANVSVGTPSLSYLVALDTGSDLFWLPCDCTSATCVTGLNITNGEEEKRIDFNIYRPNTSSTSKNVPCSSSLCSRGNQCSSPSDTCPYMVSYLSEDTSSNGFLVEDVLHLTTDNGQAKPVDAKIALGCGKVQTGAFLEGAAPNGLFGLGMENISVPSILANEGLASNSFSLCFGRDGVGRIEFGDKGSSEQSQTPFNLGQKHPSYNISISAITVGGNSSSLDSTAIFDSGTSFTYINDPAYSLITKKFDSLVPEKRHSFNSSIPFKYCYELSPNETSFKYPKINLTMKGGDQFFVAHPLVLVFLRGRYIYCLGVVKSEDVNIIGQNFMTGYRIVFDREKMVLGWKESNCYDDENINTLPLGPSSEPAIPPATVVNSQATANNAQETGPSVPGTSHLNRLNPIAYAFLVILLPFFTVV